MFEQVYVPEKYELCAICGVIAVARISNHGRTLPMCRDCATELYEYTPEKEKIDAIIRNR